MEKTEEQYMFIEGTSVKMINDIRSKFSKLCEEITGADGTDINTDEGFKTSVRALSLMHIVLAEQLGYAEGVFLGLMEGTEEEGVVKNALERNRTLSFNVAFDAGYEQTTQPEEETKLNEVPKS